MLYHFLFLSVCILQRIAASKHDILNGTDSCLAVSTEPLGCENIKQSQIKTGNKLARNWTINSHILQCMNYNVSKAIVKKKKIHIQRLEFALNFFPPPPPPPLKSRYELWRMWLLDQSSPKQVTIMKWVSKMLCWTLAKKWLSCSPTVLFVERPW